MVIRLERELSGSILDIGGGGEGVIGRLYGRQVTAVDNRQEELDEAPGGFEKVLMDARDLTYPDGSFHNVTFFYSLMFMDADTQRKAVAEAVRVLRPGGRMCVWDGEIPSAFPEPFLAELEILLPHESISTTYGVVSDIRGQTAETVLEMCSRHGMRPVECRAYGGHFYLELEKTAPGDERQRI